MYPCRILSIKRHISADSTGAARFAEMIAFCDVNNGRNRKGGWFHAKEKWPKANTYSDWREMLEKEGDKLDGITVTTPDHMHAPITMTALNLGIACYTQKPLTRTVHEARQLALAAKEAGVATQMGNQHHNGRTYKTLVELIRGGAKPMYAASGHLLYFDHATDGVCAVPFDLEKLCVTGKGVVVLEGVFSEPGMAQIYYAVSPSGNLAYVPTTGHEREDRLLWVDREGQETLIRTGTRIYHPSVSPDGTRIATAEWLRGNTLRSDIVVYDIRRGATHRVTSEGRNLFPTWNPDGEQLLFLSLVDFGAYSRRSDGSGSVTSVLSGSYIAQIAREGEVGVVGLPEVDIYTFADERFESIETAQRASAPRLSPDGRWLAYHAFETGRLEVYLQPSSDATPGRRQIVSVGGGRAPVWSPDGTELFFRSTDGRKMMAVSVSENGDLEISEPRLLFERRYDVEPGFHLNYDVAPDGRFVMVKGGRFDPPPQIRVVENWFDELRRLVPVA